MRAAKKRVLAGVERHEMRIACILRASEGGFSANWREELGTFLPLELWF